MQCNASLQCTIFQPENPERAEAQKAGKSTNWTLNGGESFGMMSRPGSSPEDACKIVANSFVGKGDFDSAWPHQSLGYRTPDEVYASGTGGGACIVDKFSQKQSSDGSSEVTQQQSAA
ncbi:hypothetical protein [Chlorobaculum sp. 24CR]|uniref:hypothetical protein n=1 Tax=Chlorobaculum sp. 24CR TaxID=2508878 RepID=UPI0014311344|nr:hypothetical protein [Chlorobaculum sp. 24CR]